MRIMFLNQSPRRPADDAYYARVQALLQSYASAGTQVELSFPDEYRGAGVAQAMGARGVRSELPYALSVPALVRKAVWAEANGYNAVVQSSGVLDPGVEASRLAVRIPVIGICRATTHVAASLAERIGVTVPFDGYVRPTRRLLRSYGMDSSVVDVRSLGMAEVPSSASGAPGHENIRARATHVMRSLVYDSGAECIVPLGGAFIPYEVSPTELEVEVGAPVLNPKAISIRFAEMCVHLGLSHSSRAYPPAGLSFEEFVAHGHS